MLVEEYQCQVVSRLLGSRLVRCTSLRRSQDDQSRVGPGGRRGEERRRGKGRGRDRGGEEGEVGREERRGGEGRGEAETEEGRKER